MSEAHQERGPGVATAQTQPLPTPLVLVVGLGERGGRVVAGLEREPPFGPDDDDPSRHLNRMALLCDRHSLREDASVREEGGARALAGMVVSRLERMLAHAAAEDARRKHPRTSKFEEPTAATVLLFADLGEDAVRDVLQAFVEQLQLLVDERLFAIVDRHDVGRWERMRLLPVLTTPTHRAPAAMREIEAKVTELVSWLGRADLTRIRLVPTVYLMEEVTDISLLSSTDVDAMLENFALLMAETGDGSVRRIDDRQAASQEQPLSLWRGDGEVKLSAFSVARGEPFRARIAAYLRAERGRRILEALLAAKVDENDARGVGDVGKTKEERAAADSHLGAPLRLGALGLPHERPPELDAELRAGVEHATAALRVLPPVPAWTRLKDEIGGRWGPLSAAAEGELPEGAKAVVAAAERALAELLATAFDSLGDRLRTRVSELELGAEGHSLDQRVAAHVDAALSMASPQARSHRAAQAETRRLLATLRAHLAEVAPTRDAMRLDEVSFEPLRGALGEAGAAGAAIPELGVMLTCLTVATLLLTVALSPLCARGVVWAGANPRALLGAAVLPAGFGVALICSLAFVVLLAWRVLSPRIARGRRAWEQVRDALEAVTVGERGSIVSHFRSRIAHAWAVGYAGALGRTIDRLETSLERLRAFDRALVGARSRFEALIDESGLAADDAPADGRRPLVWPLVSREALSEARERQRADEGLATDVHDFLLRSDMYRRWRAELPFLDDARMQAALRALRDDEAIFAPLAAGCARAGREFAVAQWRSLPKTLGDKTKHAAAFEGIVLPNGTESPETTAEESREKIAYFTGGAGTSHARWFAIRVTHGIAVEDWKQARRYQPPTRPT